LPAERHNQKRRITQTISADMAVMIEYKLFEEVRPVFPFTASRRAATV
jgi:hypothetical protein